MSNVYSDLDVNSNKVTNVTTPTADTDGATKLYADISPKEYIICTNSVSGTSTTNLHQGTYQVAQLTGNSTINGDFSVSGNGIQTDFTGIAYINVNLHLISDTGSARLSSDFQLRRTRSATPVELGPITNIYARSVNSLEASNSLSCIQSVQNGDVFEVVCIGISNITGGLFLAEAGTSEFFMIRLG